jgi:hypothetical protein
MMQTIVIILPAMVSVRISQMNDAFKFSRESQLAVVAAPAPFLNWKVIESFRLQNKAHTQGENPLNTKNVHVIHNCSPLQQIAMAEKIGAWRLGGLGAGGLILYMRKCLGPPPGLCTKHADAE